MRKTSAKKIKYNNEIRKEKEKKSTIFFDVTSKGILSKTSTKKIKSNKPVLLLIPQDLCTNCQTTINLIVVEQCIEKE